LATNLAQAPTVFPIDEGNYDAGIAPDAGDNTAGISMPIGQLVCFDQNQTIDGGHGVCLTEVDGGAAGFSLALLPISGAIGGGLTVPTDAGTQAPLISVSGCNGAAASGLIRREEGTLGYDKGQAADAGFHTPFSSATTICALGWSVSGVGATDGGLTNVGIVNYSATGITLGQFFSAANGTAKGTYWVDGY
jgi:hypothetical protein